MADAPYRAALDVFCAAPSGWNGLPFFRDGSAERVTALVDTRVREGARVLPAPGDVFNAFAHHPPEAIRAVVLGQDPYPTPGDAHGLAFSYAGQISPGTGRLPASLRNIFKEMAADLGGTMRTNGNLSDWAGQGVLLINTALTVEAGAAGAHLKFGWERLAREALAAVSQASPGAVFLLWGAPAQRHRDLVDEARHLVLASAHPSPLSAMRGFMGSKPFSRANAWLEARGLAPIEWRG